MRERKERDGGEREREFVALDRLRGDDDLMVVGGEGVVGGGDDVSAREWRERSMGVVDVRRGCWV